ncbi:MFS transporter [Streptomyces sp. VRA16 Mangrove soil]|uniref:MFS transporter n=1 Tax=Streptomyces sp. VRA16 Mangrove soil TaxID=2817434 RepID=UPI001A9CF1F8|nr:MFS transporter [Streptomyces sp. VRA16 Mangrove soil]MBO1331381.1 MFS transporter [Streptomyces sp. VRA16 Mangrove soil]
MTALSAPAGSEVRRVPGALLAALAAPAAMGISGPALVLPAAARDLGVTAGVSALLMTAYGIGMAVGTPLLTSTAGRRGPAGMIRAGALLVALGAATVVLAPGLPSAVAGRAVLAMGAAGMNVAAFQLASRDPAGRAAGLVAIGSAAGGTVGLFGGAAVAAAIGWRGALILPLLSLCVLSPALRLAGRTQPVDAVPSAGRPAARLPAILRDGRFRAAAGLMLLVSTVNFALVSTAPRRIVALTGWSAVHTGAFSSLTTLAGALLSWQLIRAAPQLGERRVRILLVAGSLSAATVAAFAPWPALVLLGSGTSALASTAGQGLLTGAATRSLSEELRGPAVGWFNLAFLAGVAAGPVVATFADQTVQFIY